MSEFRWQGLVIDRDRWPAWLSPGLRGALAKPDEDPIGAVLASMRLLRSRYLDAADRRQVRERLIGWSGEELWERLGTAVEGHAQRMLDNLHAWVRLDPDADEELGRAFREAPGRPQALELDGPDVPAVEGVAEPSPEWVSPPFAPWELVVDRDDAESLVGALTLIVLEAAEEGAAFWERRSRELLEGPDRVADALQFLLARRLASEPSPTGAAWVREIVHRESACWWLDAVLRAAAMRVGVGTDRTPRRSEEERAEGSGTRPGTGVEQVFIPPADRPAHHAPPFRSLRIEPVESRAGAEMSCGSARVADERIAAGEAVVVSRRAVPGLGAGGVVIELRAVDWEDLGQADRSPGIIVGFASDTPAVLVDVRVTPVLPCPPARSDVGEAWWVPLDGDVPAELEFEVRVRLYGQEATVRLAVRTRSRP